MVLVVLLVACALSIRLHRLDDALLVFHPIRQYRSAIIARACYYDYDGAVDVPGPARRAAAAARAMQPAGEPPIMEWLVCAAYRVAGREWVAAGGALAAFSWILGAPALWALSRRVGSGPAAALVGLAVYLFLPYGITASRAFQPDALMTCCALWALLAILRWDERPSAARLLVAAAAAAVAALVKPMSVFLTTAAIGGLAVARHGWRRGVRHGPTLLLVALALAPAAIYYGGQTLFGTFMKDQWRLRFVPALLASPFFWAGWWTQIRRVLTVPGFAAGTAGTVFAPTGRARALLAALWIGYAAYAAAFTYHMPTHDYYHLPYVAVAALGAAACAGALERRLAASGRARWALPLALMAAGVIAAAGSAAAWPRLTAPDGAARAARYAEIGALVQHDTRVLFLDRDYGYPLMYHGHVSGDAWPNVEDLNAEALGGAPAIDAAARFERDYAAFEPTYFVVTDLASLAAQPDLARLLEMRATPVRRTAAYHVYRFRQ